jgi:hypothetical protein
MSGKLTDKLIREITPTAKAQIVADGNGLAIWVTPYAGNLAWRYRFRWERKATMISLGVYEPKSPDHVPLKLARERRYECQKLLEQGTKPYPFWKTKKSSAARSHLRGSRFKLDAKI